MPNEVDRPAVKIERNRVLFPVPLHMEAVLVDMGSRVIRPGQTVERTLEKNPVYMVVPEEVLWVEVENEKEKKRVQAEIAERSKKRVNL